MNKKTEKRIKQLIAEVVAEHYAMLLEMAYDRDTFVSKLREHMSGALHEHLKGAIAKRCGHKQAAQGWINETGSLLRALSNTFNHKVTGFKDKKKALHQARALVEKDQSLLRSSISQAKSTLDLSKKTTPQLAMKAVVFDQDLKDFWKKAAEFVPELLKPNN